MQGPEAPCRTFKPLANVQRVMTLVDTGTECSLIYGKQEQFPGPSAHIDGYGDQTVKAVSLPLEIEQVPV